MSTWLVNLNIAVFKIGVETWGGGRDVAVYNYQSGQDW